MGPTTGDWVDPEGPGGDMIRGVEPRPCGVSEGKTLIYPLRYVRLLTLPATTEDVVPEGLRLNQGLDVPSVTPCLTVLSRRGRPTQEKSGGRATHSSGFGSGGCPGARHVIACPDGGGRDGSGVVAQGRVPSPLWRRS